MTFYFGILSDIDSDVALASFILTIVFLSSFNFCLGALEFAIRDNPIYNQMLQKIYKELMCMGFVNFVVVLLTATNNNERISEWIDIIDFVGYMLFFVAIFFVLHAFYIMFMSFHTSKKYAQQHSISLAETLQIYSRNKDNFFKNILFHLRYFPVSNALKIVEFKIIYALFRDTYWLPPKFDYGLYLSGCLERYSLQVINIGFTSWAVMVVLSVANYLRLKYMGVAGFNCRGYHTDPNRVPSDDEPFDPNANPYDTVSQRCHIDHLKLFCLSGGVVCLYALLVFLVSRFYVKRLLCRAGVPATDIYAEFLMFEESLNLSEQMEDAQRNVEINLPAHSANRLSSRRRMSINTFRGQITTLRQESMHEDESQAVYKTLTKSLSNLQETYFSCDWLYNARTWLRLKIAKLFESGDEDKSKRYQNQSFIFRRMSAAAPVTPLGMSGPETARRSSVTHRRSSTTITLSGGPLGNKPVARLLQKQPSVIPTPSTTPSVILAEAGKQHMETEPAADRKRSENFKPVTLAHMAPNTKQSWSTIEQFKLKQESKKAKDTSRKRSTIEDYKDTKNKMKLTEDFSDIYFFASPRTYFRAVELVILLNSLYLSIWAVNFISVASEEAENPVIWQLLMLTPLMVCVPLVGEIVKTASLLSAIAELEVDVIGSVLENMEDENALLRELQGKISCRLVHVNMQAEKQEIVHALFYEIDTDRSGFISRFEFRDMLRALHLHYSDHKFRKLFNVIDKDRSGTISEQELTDVVFPDEARDDDVKNRSKIVNEHLEVHNERKKLEHSRSTLKLASKGGMSKHWSRISNMTKGIGHFKQKNTASAPLATSSLLQLNEVLAAPGACGDGDHHSSSSRSGSDSDSDGSCKGAGKVGIEEVTPFDERGETKSTRSLLSMEGSQEEKSEDSGGNLSLVAGRPSREMGSCAGVAAQLKVSGGRSSDDRGDEQGGEDEQERGDVVVTAVQDF